MSINPNQRSEAALEGLEPKKPHIVNLQIQSQIKTFAGMGVKLSDMALMIGISVDTIREYYQNDFETGSARANFNVAQSLYKKALGNGAGAVEAAKFWLRNRGGWRDVGVFDNDGTPGGAVEPAGGARSELRDLLKKYRGYSRASDPSIPEDEDDAELDTNVLRARLTKKSKNTYRRKFEKPGDRFRDKPPPPGTRPRGRPRKYRPEEEASDGGGGPESKSTD